MTEPPLYVPRPPRSKEEKLARLYDDEIYPLVARRLDQMVLARLALPPGAHVLFFGCGAGASLDDVVDRLDTEGRVVALDPSSALLDRARARIGEAHPGRRVFFRQHDPGDKLPFAEGSYDLVVATLDLGAVDKPNALVADLARVCKPGGSLSLATTLRGTWAEFTDIFRDTLVQRSRAARVEELGGRATYAPLTALDSYLDQQPDADRLAHQLEEAGMAALEIERQHWELLFRSAREFLYAPIIEHGPLPRWKEIAGRGAEMQEIFLLAKEAIETYFAGRTFAVSVEAAALRGVKTPPG